MKEEICLRGKEWKTKRKKGDKEEKVNEWK